MGTANRTPIGTLIERSTRYVMVLHLPAGRRAEQVHNALLDHNHHRDLPTRRP